jgi:hypothetical protein
MMYGRHGNKNWKKHTMSYKGIGIVNAAFNTWWADHLSFDQNENDSLIIYTEPYEPIDIQNFDMEIINKWDISLIPLKESKHDPSTHPYKIVVGNLKKPIPLEREQLEFGYRKLTLGFYMTLKPGKE